LWDPHPWSSQGKDHLDTFYVMENDQKVYVEPNLKATVLSDTQGQLILAQEMTRDQWTSLFLAIKQGNFPVWLICEASKKGSSVNLTEALQLESPVKPTEKTGMFAIFPALSYEDDASIGEDSTMSGTLLTTEEVTTTIKDFKQRFSKIKQKWSSDFQDIEVNHLIVATDLDKLSSLTNVLSARLGTPPDPSAVDVPVVNVWQTLTHMYTKVQHGLTHTLSLVQVNTENLEDLSSNYATLHSMYESLTQSMEKLQDLLQQHENRFSKILPFMRNIQQNGTVQTNTSTVIATLDQKLLHLEQAIESLQDKQWQAAFTPTSNVAVTTNLMNQDLDAKVRDLDAKVQALQMHFVGNGVQIGGVVFQCFEDVKAW